MTTQLALITTAEVPAGGEQDTAEAQATARPAPRSRRRAARRGGRPGPGQVGWLDRGTIETGRQGVAAARAALADASRRAHEREEAELRRREEQLVEAADRRRHPAGRRRAA
ncbi:MAG: hypothetical protein ACOYOP_09815 [Microthrixaceae bacterium]